MPPNCIGSGTLYLDTKVKFPPGCKKVVYEYWWTPPHSLACENSYEICTRRWYGDENGW